MYLVHIRHNGKLRVRRPMRALPAMLDLGLTKMARSAETAGKQDRPFKVGDITMWPVHSTQQQATQLSS